MYFIFQIGDVQLFDGINKCEYLLLFILKGTLPGKVIVDLAINLNVVDCGKLPRDFRRDIWCFSL